MPGVAHVHRVVLLAHAQSHAAGLHPLCIVARPAACAELNESGAGCLASVEHVPPFHACSMHAHQEAVRAHAHVHRLPPAWRAVRGRRACARPRALVACIHACLRYALFYAAISLPSPPAGGRRQLVVERPLPVTGQLVEMGAVLGGYARAWSLLGGSATLLAPAHLKAVAAAAACC